LVCSAGVDHDAVAEFRKNENQFFIVVRSKHACALPLGKMSIIFHNYRMLFMSILIVLGIYCNFWGTRNLQLTLRVIGFSICFLFSFFILIALFDES
jgi:hypothetical protein